MHTHLSRLDYLDGLGTLSERVAYRAQLEHDHLILEKRHTGLVILRRVVIAVSFVIVMATVTLALIAIGSYIVELLP